MRKVLAATQRIVLSERDTPRVLKLLRQPPKPTAALLAAARSHARKKKLYLLGFGGMGDAGITQ